MWSFVIPLVLMQSGPIQVIFSTCSFLNKVKLVCLNKYIKNKFKKKSDISKTYFSTKFKETKRLIKSFIRLLEANSLQCDE